MFVRDATLDDLPAIVAIYNAAIPGRIATADTDPVTVESRKEWFDKHEPGRRPLWVAEMDGEVVAWIRPQLVLCGPPGLRCHGGSEHVHCSRFSEPQTGARADETDHRGLSGVWRHFASSHVLRSQRRKPKALRCDGFRACWPSSANCQARRHRTRPHHRHFANSRPQSGLSRIVKLFSLFRFPPRKPKLPPLDRTGESHGSRCTLRDSCR